MDELNKNIIKIYGTEGKQWLDSLTEITAKIAKEHNLSGLTLVNNMTFNYVASGYQNDKPTRRGEASLWRSPGHIKNWHEQQSFN